MDSDAIRSHCLDDVIEVTVLGFVLFGCVSLLIDVKRIAYRAPFVDGFAVYLGG